VELVGVEYCTFCERLFFVRSFLQGISYGANAVSMSHHLVLLRFDSRSNVMSLRRLMPLTLMFLFVSLVTRGTMGHEGCGSNLFRFEDHGRWSRTATDGGGLGQGDPTTISWSIVPDGTPITPAYPGESNDPSSLISFLDTIRGGDPADPDLTLRPWFSVFSDSFDRWGEVAGLSFVYEPNDGGDAIDGGAFPYGRIGVRGDVRIGGHSIDGQSDSNTLAYNYFPNHGDMVIDTDNVAFYSSTANDSRRFRNVVMHEHGHGLGFAHVESSDSRILMEPFISTLFDGPQFDDVWAAHRGYGDVNERGGGNDTFGNATDLGTIDLSETVTIGEDATDMVVARTDIDFVSIDDNLDVDFYQFTVNSASFVDVTLTPLGPTYLEGPEDGPESRLDSSAQSDLALEILDTDGTTSLGSADADGSGLTEALSGIALAAPGTYFVEITGADDAAQMYQLDVTVVPEPSAFLLIAACLLGLLWYGAVRSHRKRTEGTETTRHLPFFNVDV